MRGGCRARRPTRGGTRSRAGAKRPTPLGGGGAEFVPPSPGTSRRQAAHFAVGSSNASQSHSMRTICPPGARISTMRSSTSAGSATWWSDVEATTASNGVLRLVSLELDLPVLGSVRRRRVEADRVVSRSAEPGHVTADRAAAELEDARGRFGKPLADPGPCRVEPAVPPGASRLGSALRGQRARVRHAALHPRSSSTLRPHASASTRSQPCIARPRISIGPRIRSSRPGRPTRPGRRAPTGRPGRSRRPPCSRRSGTPGRRTSSARSRRPRRHQLADPVGQVLVVRHLTIVEIPPRRPYSRMDRVRHVSAQLCERASSAALSSSIAA